MRKQYAARGQAVFSRPHPCAQEPSGSRIRTRVRREPSGSRIRTRVRREQAALASAARIPAYPTGTAMLVPVRTRAKENSRLHLRRERHRALRFPVPKRTKPAKPHRRAACRQKDARLGKSSTCTGSLVQKNSTKCAKRLDFLLIELYNTQYIRMHAQNA